MWLGVAALRVYPAVNATGVGLVPFLVVLLTGYPVAAMALGGLAVAPAEWLGKRIWARHV